MQVSSCLRGVVFLAALIFAGIAPAALASSKDDRSWTWDYATERTKEGDVITTTTRASLLISNPGTDAERRFQVRSICRRSPGEAVYGACRHGVSEVGKESSFEIDAGEDVGLAYLGGLHGRTAPVLAAVTRACCSDESQVALFTATGEKLGYLETAGDYRPVMDRTWDFLNVTSRGEALVLKEAPAGKDRLYVVLRLNRDGSFTREPAAVAIKGASACDAWTIAGFVGSSHVDDQATLTMRGNNCGDMRLRSGLCRRANGRWTCGLAPVSKP
jgi:hypothetical protein